MKYIIFIFIIISANFVFADLTEGLVAHYPFNGNANDESGNGYNGTVFDAIPSEDRFGNTDCAYYFDGENDIIVFGNILNSVFSSNTFSISCWFRDVSGSGMVISKENQNEIDFILYAQGIWQTSSDTTNFSTSSLSEWHHIVINTDLGDVTIFLDNQQVAMGDAHSCDYLTASLAMGNYNFNGNIDDVRIYDRTLSEDEIDTLFHLGNWMDSPQNVCMSIISENIELCWDEVPGADFYNVYSDDEPYGDFTILEYAGEDTFCTIPANGTERFYRTIAHNQDEIIVNFTSPEQDENIPSCQYLLAVTTPNPNIVRAEFRLAFTYWVGGVTPTCDYDASYDLIMCEDNTPGNEFSCLADFSQVFLVPLDIAMCLQAKLFDAEGNSGEAVNMVWVDNMLPETIDLNATPSSFDGRINLDWIAPGESGMNGEVEDYDIKISTQSILTEGDFDNAINIQGGCAVINPEQPGTSQSCYVTEYNGSSFPVNCDTIYYFAIKATDEAGNYSISNSPGCVAPYHEIIVESIYVVNAKDSFDANYWGHTNYLYDTLAVSGDITNNGNLDETVDVRLERRFTTLVDTIEAIISQGTTQLVTGLEYAETTESEFDLNLEVGNSNQLYQNIQVWSIAEHTGIEWYEGDVYPAPEEPANEPFWIYVWIMNTAFQRYYDYPIEIFIDAPFTTNVLYAGADYYCVDDCKKCYYNLAPNCPNYDSHYIMWEVDGLPAGTYEITVTAGEYPEDSITIYKTVEMVE